MGAIVTALGAWLFRFVGTGIMVALGYVLSDWILGLIGQAFTLFSNSVTNTTFSLPTLQTTISAFPPQMLSIMKRIRLDDGLSVIITAVTVRTAASVFNFIRMARRGATS